MFSHRSICTPFWIPDKTCHEEVFSSSQVWFAASQLHVAQKMSNGSQSNIHGFSRQEIEPHPLSCWARPFFYECTRSINPFYGISETPFLSARRRYRSPDVKKALAGGARKEPTQVKNGIWVKGCFKLTVKKKKADSGSGKRRFIKNRQEAWRNHS